MSAKINPVPSSSAPLSLKNLFWRIALTILILMALAGPGAQLLQQLVIS